MSADLSKNLPTKKVPNDRLNLKKSVNKKCCAPDMEVQVGTFLEKHRIPKGQRSTHSTLQPGGVYYINEDSIQNFMTLYCNAIIKKARSTITETPEKYGPLRIDVDLKTSLDIGTKRQYGYDTIKSLISFYQAELKDALEVFEDETQEERDRRLICILLEKDPRVDNGIVKDGFHLHFPFFICDGWFQDDYLRTRVLSKTIEHKLWSGFKYLEPPEKFIDSTGIAKKNWLMYGSAKNLNIEPFLVSKIYDHTLKEITLEECFKNEMIGKKLKVKYYLPQFLSIRGYQEVTPIKPEIEAKKMLVIKKRKNAFIQKKRSEEDIIKDLALIKSAQFLDMLSDDRADDYQKWMEVGWALFNIGQGCDEARDMWIQFSKRSPKFVDGVCEEEWSKMRMSTYSLGTIKHLAKLDNPDRYKEWKDTDVRSNIDNSLYDKPNEWDMAKVVYCKFSDRFRCADAKRDIWYEFKNHRWNPMDDGIPLRRLLLEDIIEEYKKRKKQIEDTPVNNTGREENDRKTKKCNEMISSLKTCAFQDKVIRMCRILFHDPSFMKKMDENRMLFGCENGVLNLETNTFRDGTPDDYVSFSCGIEYPKYMSPQDDEILELNEFFSKVFTNPNVRNYFLDNVAFSMEGGNVNKTFCIGTGDGDNAKTVTYSLIEMVFGEYCIKFPRELFIVGKGNSSSGARPELSRVRGKRVGIVQEIAKTETLNIGVLKELTGNDSFFARGLFEKGTDIKPMFTLFSQMNEPPNVPGHDEASWNRIRIVDFNSKFVGPKDKDKWPVPETTDEQFAMRRFHADVTFRKRLPDLCQAFLWSLVERRKALKATGLREPEEVRNSTNNYRSRNDVYAQFIDDLIEKPLVEKGQPKPFLKVSDLHNEFQVWYMENHSSYAKEKINRITLIHEFSKRFGAISLVGKEKGWYGYRIVSDNPEEQLQNLLGRK